MIAFFIIAPSPAPPPPPVKTYYISREGLPGEKLKIEKEDKQPPILRPDKSGSKHHPYSKLGKAKSPPPSINRRGERESKQPNKRHLT